MRAGDKISENFLLAKISAYTVYLFDPHSRMSIQATNITCTTVEFTASAPPVNGTVMVMIDSATISSNSVEYTYTPNPEFYSVTPSNTILG